MAKQPPFPPPVGNFNFKTHVMKCSDCQLCHEEHLGLLALIFLAINGAENLDEIVDQMSEWLTGRFGTSKVLKGALRILKRIGLDRFINNTNVDINSGLVIAAIILRSDRMFLEALQATPAISQAVIQAINLWQQQLGIDFMHIERCSATRALNQDPTPRRRVLPILHRLKD